MIKGAGRVFGPECLDAGRRREYFGLLMAFAAMFFAKESECLSKQTH